MLCVGDKIKTLPELRFWGVEGVSDALTEVNVVVERKVYGVADSEEKNLHARY
jgi:hypothetical protein